MKKILTILLTLAMPLSMAACGGSAEEDPNAGKYITDNDPADFLLFRAD